MPTIKEQLDRIPTIDIKPDISSLSNDERQAIAYCIGASAAINDLYLTQAAHGNLERFKKWQTRSDADAEYYRYMGVPWDKFNANKLFILDGHATVRPSSYPEDLEKAEFTSWLADHPEDKPMMESPCTILERDGSTLHAVPYSTAYAQQLAEVQRALTQAAKYVKPGALQTFLRARARAFASNDYSESDIEWLKTDSTPFEVTMGPYETYFDTLLGVKASFEAFIAIPDSEATTALKHFKPYVQQFGAQLNSALQLAERTDAAPMVVVRDVLRAGDANFGTVTLAYNLPNDQNVKAAYGSKRVFSRTLMEACFMAADRQIARDVLHPSYADTVNFDDHLLFILGHELSHGLGPGSHMADGTPLSFLKTHGNLYGVIEEAKASTLGLELLQYFADAGELTQAQVDNAVHCNFILNLRRWQRGFSEAHTRGGLMEYNWMMHDGAIKYDPVQKNFFTDPTKMRLSLASLAHTLMDLQIDGTYSRAEAFVNKWTVIPEEIKSVIKQLRYVPIALRPQWDLTDLKKELTIAHVDVSRLVNAHVDK